MNRNNRPVIPLLLMLLATASLLATPLLAGAEDNMPWGSAEKADRDYEPRKVVYDVYSSSPEELESILDRVSMLNNLYEADPFDAHIVLVLHGDEVAYFTRDGFEEHEELMRRAKSLTDAGPVEFRMCEAAARAHDIEPRDVHGFVKVVPMADAEMIELQHKGYLFMQ